MKAHPNSAPHAILGSLVLALVVSTSISAAAATHYVDANSPGPVPPYLSWATAATVIQDAVDVAAGGDEIVVTNGTYAAGGRALYNAFTNRVAVTKPLLLRSVNGPAVTAIQGYQIPGVTNGPAAIRCVYLTNGAILSGFTLTNGATLSGILYSNDYNLQQIGGGVWCETGAVVTNCFILGNSAADYGGGAYGGTLYDCTIGRNSAPNVGANGVTYGPLGGGAYLCTLSNCTLFANIGVIGGGAAQSTLNNCTLSNNLATLGGATVACTLNNCLLLSNAAVNVGYEGANGGGADYESTLRNCTIVGNSAPSRGGVYYSHVTNSIIYFNTADSGANFETTDGFTHLSYCCTTPLPASGNGNISSDPLFIDLVGGNLRLQSNSPCVNAGNNAYVVGPTDLDANSRIFGGTVDIGAYEFQGSSIPVAPYIISQPASQIIYVGGTVSFTVFAGGSSPLSYQWTLNGANLGGATNTSLTLTNIQLSQSGSYAVIVTNLAGQVVSTNAVLAVYSPATRYVAADNLNATAPYTNWNIAASNVQDAIDVAAPGDEIIVTNGVYARGGRAIDGSMTNRAALYKPVFVHSVNGPQFTMLQGRQLPGTTNGDGAIRCAYLTGGAVLAGFTLTNGATRAAGDGDTEQRGGGVFGESVTAIVSNCIVVNNSAAGSGGGAAVGFGLYNCSITGNSATVGGGAVGGVLWNCTLTGNLASDTGGGAWDITLNNCSIISNVVSGSGGSGGGVGLGTLTNCVLLGNQAASGGGAVSSTLVNCTLTANSAGNGGGASGGTLLSCLLTSNSVTGSGGAVISATLLNCTLAANSAGGDGGGVSGSSKVTNSIVYFNNAPSAPNYEPSNSMSYCCTTPLPSGGTGNIASDPQFVNLATGDLHLPPGSPCINAGNNSYAPGVTDLDGSPRIVGGNIDLGAYEYQAGGVAPFVLSQPANHSALVGDNITFKISALGTQPLTYQWRFNGTGIIGATGSSLSIFNVQLGQAGAYSVILGNAVSSLISSDAVLVVYAAPESRLHFVSGNSASPVFPYTNWTTAALSIQDAIDASLAGDQVVVSNGNYSTGGRVAYGGMTNRVAVDKPLTLRSVNGPQFTMIQGYQVPGGSNGDGAIRCIYLTNAATLSGFTLSGGATRVSGDLFRERSGGGAWCESTNVVLTNCILAFNSATNSGGGIYQGTLNNCTLTNNQTSYAGYGGAAAYSVLNGCLLMRNNATRGGGAYWATLNNCTVALNVASAGGGIAESAANNSVIYSNNYNYYYLSTTPALNYCCTTPLPSGGTGNITSNPLFVNLAAGDLHLQSGSPCINAGNNSLAPTALDLDGAPRIRDGRIDLGAYEFQSGASSIAPAIRIGLSGQNITLAWPLWASNFVLTEASTVTTPSAAWTNTPTVPTLSNGQITVTLQPTNGTLKLYRLLAH